MNESNWTWNWVPYIADIAGTKYFIASPTYNTILEPGKITEISLSQIALAPSATTAEGAAFGGKYTVLVHTQGIQATGFDNPDEALKEGFGDKIPFDGAIIDKGINLKTALHYLNGDDKGTEITANVTNVIFDLNATYPDIVQNYEGTLISVEQDAKVFAYYVPNGTNYDIYVLADGTIYTPKDSTELFRDMTALSKVDTTNMDVSRTENMTGMFRGCSKLTDIDTSKWNTENVTDMAQVFETCYALEEIIGLENWDTSNVTTMFQMFASPAGYGVSNHLKVLDLSSFDTSKVTNMYQKFQSSPDLVTIYVGDGWSTENVTDSRDMFRKCPSIVGEKGTTFDPNLFGMTYAHVDGGEENPGYFTHINNKSANP